ncbi:MAG: IclR family transcriptional regulator [Acidimicrobiia bacterium]|nr:IclR family transcriptional regulator [Acidimicrobiia bacterium]
MASIQTQKKASTGTGKYMVPVVRSTFRILAELGQAGSMSLNEVTLRTGIAKSTVFRILTTLTDLGYVIRDAGRHYYVSGALSELVNERAGSELLRRTSLSWMLRLRDAHGETVNLGQLQVDRIRYVEVVPSEFALRLHERPGAIVPVHATALGKAILAFLPPETAEGLLEGMPMPALAANTITTVAGMMAELEAVRRRGYAFDRGETSTLATCVAAPILDARGEAVAALSISGPSSRFSPHEGSDVVEDLREAAREIGRSIRHSAPLGNGKRRD